MAYTIGASHGPFTGNGSFAISKPAGIRSILTGIPSFTGHDGNIPRRYFKLGRMSLGNPHGFQFSHGLEYVQQLLYPIAPVWEILAYDIRDGASCTFYELVDVPDLTAKQPWDRTPLAWTVGSNAAPGATTATTTLWTYTVPVGRRLWLSTARVNCQQLFAPGAGFNTSVYITLDGVPILMIYNAGSGIGSRQSDDLNGAPLILPAGRVLTAYYATTQTGGQFWINALASGFLFDS